MLRALMGVTVLAVWLAACASPPAPLEIMPAKMGTHPTPRNHRDGNAYVLMDNGTLATRLRFDTVQRWGLRITAHAEAGADGVWPQLRVEIDGEAPKAIVIGNRLSVPYWMTFASEPGFADLRVSLINGRSSGNGPVLVVERIELEPL
jgi:hypothetical protein